MLQSLLVGIVGAQEVALSVQSSTLASPTLGPVGLDLCGLLGILQGMFPVLLRGQPNVLRVSGGDLHSLVEVLLGNGLVTQSLELVRGSHYLLQRIALGGLGGTHIDLHSDGADDLAGVGNLYAGSVVTAESEGEVDLVGGEAVEVAIADEHSLSVCDFELAVDVLAWEVAICWAFFDFLGECAGHGDRNTSGVDHNGVRVDLSHLGDQAILATIFREVEADLVLTLRLPEGLVTSEDNGVVGILGHIDSFGKQVAVVLSLRHVSNSKSASSFENTKIVSSLVRRRRSVHDHLVLASGFERYLELRRIYTAE
ncbi:hypothetical protein HG530_004191 [Fusarium avenaceum]|nr:hypothetical protein HG530_004191 [Fusarium avenaceum]